MSDSFDPYHRWLGIPRAQQPADYYRLLGIERFESDADVIHEAVDRQMAHVRSHQSGRYAALSQKLLNELAAARVCLLNPQKKARYDEQLRRRFGRRAAPALPAEGLSAGTMVSPSPGGGLPVIHTDAVSAEAARRGAFSPARLVVGGSLALAVLIALALATASVLQPEQDPRPETATGEVNGPGEDIDPQTDEAAPPPKVWLDASSETATAGPIEVRVDSVRIGKPGVVLMDGKGAPAQNEYLIVTLALTNTDPDNELTHGGWGGRSKQADRASLSDNRNNSYQPIRPRRGTIEGEVEDEPVVRGERLHDVVVFKRPDATPEYLRLALPASAVAQEGIMRFQIPTSMVIEEPDDHPPESSVALAEPSVDLPEPAVDRPQDVQPPPPTREPIPTVEAQDEHRRLLEEVYPTPGEPQEKRELADRLTSLAKGGDIQCTAERFVILRRASELASELGDVIRTVRLADKIADQFEVDRLRVHPLMLSTIAERFAGAEQTACEDQIRLLLDASLKVFDEATRTERLHLAESLAAAVRRACEAEAGYSFREEAQEHLDEVRELHGWWKNVQEARETLEINPDDQDAHTLVARWYASVRDDWDRALPHFAKGSEPELKVLADRELNSPPDEAMAKLELGDAWWDFAQSNDSDPNSAWAARAAHWYEKALPGITSPLRRTIVENRLKEIGGWPPRVSTHTTGVPPPSEWRLSDLLEEPGEIGPPVGDKPRAGPAGATCRRCQGRGKVRGRCANRMCARGTVSQYRTEVIGYHPRTGRITQRRRVRVPCGSCGGPPGPPPQPCPDCGGRGTR